MEKNRLPCTRSSPPQVRHVKPFTARCLRMEQVRIFSARVYIPCRSLWTIQHTKTSTQLLIHSDLCIPPASPLSVVNFFNRESRFLSPFFRLLLSPFIFRPHSLRNPHHPFDGCWTLLLPSPLPSPLMKSSETNSPPLLFPWESIPCLLSSIHLHTVYPISRSSFPSKWVETSKRRKSRNPHMLPQSLLV